jgi:hypothetical protein
VVYAGLESANRLVMTWSASKLEVIQVGDFEASFVPTVKDFSRLDERFRLPSAVWDLPNRDTFLAVDA